MTRPWFDIDAAPYSTPVEVDLGSRKVIVARLKRDASMDDQERPCDQWQAVNDDYPKDWCDGCCWSSNSEGVMSRQPIRWRHPA